MALFQIIPAEVVTGKHSVASGIRSLVHSVVGALFEFLSVTHEQSHKKIRGTADTLTTILAYSSFLIARHLHLCGVIATVLGGIMVANLGRGLGPAANVRRSPALPVQGEMNGDFHFDCHGPAVQQSRFVLPLTHGTERRLDEQGIA